MLGAGYALSKGVHIRADFLYRNFKTKTQGLIDFWLYLFYFPGLIVFLYMTTIFVQNQLCVMKEEWTQRGCPICGLSNHVYGLE